MQISEDTFGLGNSFDLILKNHDKLKGSKESKLDEACSWMIDKMQKDPKFIMFPIFEQITKSAKKSKRTPLLDVANWIHEKVPKQFDELLLSVFESWDKGTSEKRRAMGASILIRSLAIFSCCQELNQPLTIIVSQFNSQKPSVFEMELFNTMIFAVSASDMIFDGLTKSIERFSTWFSEDYKISSASASELALQIKNDKSYSKIIAKLRMDIPPSSESTLALWTQIVESPFTKTMEWISFGLSLGRFDEEHLRSEIASISRQKGDFSSVITVALSADNRSIRNVARAIFRFGIHGKEMASFDPSSLSSILEQSDELTDIALTFLCEMSLSNPEKCVPQLFPLLSSDKPQSRKNALALLQKIVDGKIEASVLNLIASNLIPLVGDDAISVRVDIPKLFASTSTTFIVPSLMRMLSDPNEKKRSTASASIKLIMEKCEDPENLLKIILDYALTTGTVPNSPAAIGAMMNDKKSAERVLGLVENWAKEYEGKLFLDPTPVLSRLWEDPQNEIIVSFISKSSPIYDQTRLISAILTKLRKKTENMFDSLAPLLVLRSQPLDFFLRRETVASPIFNLLNVRIDEQRPIMKLRAEILARFSPQFVMPQIIEMGLMDKMNLYIICIAGNIHPLPIPYVCDEFEKVFDSIPSELFEPVCDAFFFSDRDRYITYALKHNDPKKMFMMLLPAFQKYSPNDCEIFVKKGYLGKLLSKHFGQEEEKIAIHALFVFVFQTKSNPCIDPHWETLFDIASFFSDHNNSEVRFAAIKLLGALITNPIMESHLAGSFDRFMHIITIRSDEGEDPRIRELARTLLESTKPKLE